MQTLSQDLPQFDNRQLPVPSRLCVPSRTSEGALVIKRTTQWVNKATVICTGSGGLLLGRLEWGRERGDREDLATSAQNIQRLIFYTLEECPHSRKPNLPLILPSVALPACAALHCDKSV
uniref:Uncharacterized protein n=1 Tax=Knipowitschia caucasica TaxID=637954 RepID=A0AAV2KPS1_KNICA